MRLVVDVEAHHHMNRQSTLLTATAILLALMGLTSIGGGLLLVALGGSWYFLAAGAALLVSAVRLDAAESSALGIFCGVLATTLVWSLFEVGLDWWSVAAPGDVLFIVGLLLWTPWIGRSLADRAVPAVSGNRPPWRAKHYRRTLGLVLATYAVVALASWFGGPMSTEAASCRTQPLSPRFMNKIAPAPRKPIPLTTCAATREGSSTPCAAPSVSEKPNGDPTRTSMCVRKPAVH